MSGFYEVHCHILPGVDDGAEDLEEAKNMLRQYYRDGVRTIYATPHYRKRMFEPSMELIMERYQQLKMESERIGEGIRLYLGCEYHADLDIVDNLNAGKRPVMGNSRCVLTEFSLSWDYSGIRERCYELLSNGYEPILAHAERYPALVKRPELIKHLVEMGAYIQINAESLLGYTGFSSRRFCKYLIREDLLHLIGSDAHGIKKRIPRIGQCREYLEKKEGYKYMEKIMVQNPQIILEGKK